MIVLYGVKGEQAQAIKKLLLSSRAGRFCVLLGHSIFEFLLDVVFCVIELTDTTAQSTHELRDLASAK
jgi:hypothetical protein